TGKHTVTRPIRHLKKPPCTFSSRKATANFSRAHHRTATFRKFASILRFYPTPPVQISHLPDRAVVRRRSKICRKNASTACWRQRRNSDCNKKRIGFATRSTVMAATKRCFKKSRPRLVTKKTNCHSL